ncbi:MAG: RNA methyltransferase [Muribaculaceae bacterium]|nr:RNA methyltransferase [Muribaculaceae bacterium]
MLTTKIIKAVQALAEHKGRRESGLFVAEGTKCVCDTLEAFEPERLFATEDWLASHPAEAASARERGAVVEPCKKGQLRELSSLTATPPVIAVYRMPEPAEASAEACTRELVVALDRVQDPGNLGTIMRTADWMGVSTIVASKDTVDLYNPKVVQATMGAISRVRVAYVADLAEFLSEASEAGARIYGTFLDGADIYTAALGATGVLVMGNEGSGISAEVAERVNERLLIPSFPPERPTSESLNVATATAIALSQFRSRQMKSRN